MKTKILLLLLLGPLALRAADPVKLSSVGHSMFYRGGNGYVGNAGMNGGSYTESLFNGSFTDYLFQNTAGAELVMSTTGRDDDDADTGEPWYVTEISIGHAGNTKYSLYYTTEPAPDYSGLTLINGGNNNFYYAGVSDSRAWTPIEGATDIQASGKKTYSVNVVATAVKYVFDTTLDWTTSLAEVEVLGVDPAEMGCQHPSFTEWEAVPGSATCTGYGDERRKCTVCGEEFFRNSLPPLGHDWVTHLSKPGSSSAYGSGTLECSRCSEKLVFVENTPIDLTTEGGVAADGLIQFTDLSVSSSAPDGGGTGPDDLIDGDWTWGWGHYWFAASRSESEYVQYDFGTEIDLTKIEWSAPNHALTLKFYLWDGETEEPLAEVPVANDGSDNDYQRGSLSFRGVSAKGLRLHIADPTGIGYNGISPVGLSELHPYGTVKGAGLLDVVRTRILLY